MKEQMKTSEQAGARFSCHLQRDYGNAPCASDCGRLRCMYPSTLNTSQPPSDAVQNILFMVYAYARISDGIDRAEGETRRQQREAMRAKAEEIRTTLSQTITVQQEWLVQPLPESMSRDEMLKHYSAHANLAAHEALRYQKRIRDLEAALAAREEAKKE